MKHSPPQLILRLKKPDVIRLNELGLEQLLFTQYSNIPSNSILHDRPYAAYLPATNFSVLINREKKLKLSNELNLGVLVTTATGECTQTKIQKIIWLLKIKL